MVKVRYVKRCVRNWLGFTFASAHGQTTMTHICNACNGMWQPEEYEECSEEFEIPFEWKPKNGRTFFG